MYFACGLFECDRTEYGENKDETAVDINLCSEDTSCAILVLVYCACGMAIQLSRTGKKNRNSAWFNEETK